MLVKKESWHYKLVQHKEFVSNPKNDNSDAIAYIIEVLWAIFLYFLAFPLVLIMVVFCMSSRPDKKELLIIIFCIITSP